MKKTKIIGHRGAAGLATENTLDAIRAAKKLGVDAIEIDVRFTKDAHLVLLHDGSLKRIWGEDRHVWNMTLDEVKRLRSDGNQTIPTLEEALKVIGKTPVIIDIKDSGSAEAIAEIMDRQENKNKDWYVSSDAHKELIRLRRLKPSAKVFFTTHFSHSIETVRVAKKAGAFGVSTNIWAMNVLTYWLARQFGLVTMVYVYKPSFVLNTKLLVKFFRLFYPDFWVITNRPDKIAPLIKS